MVQGAQLISAALGACLAYVGPAVYSRTAPQIARLLDAVPLTGKLSQQLSYLYSPWNRRADNITQPANSEAYHCLEKQGYRTELISLDPLLIYIHNFVSPREAELVIQAGKALLQPSPVTGYGGDTSSQARTSWSAPLPEPKEDAAVACVLGRAESFLGTTLKPGRDDIGAAQLVHYTPGQKFDLHHDWFRQPRITEADAKAERRRLYNRVATFFVVLQANCTGGETYFPQAKPITGWPTDATAEADASGTGTARTTSSPVWRRHENGGLAFRPIPGNAVFWVNLLGNGTGDARTLHAGLPVGSGTKTAMNIWPRTFFGPDA